MKNAKVSGSLQLLFDEYKGKIIDDNYYPNIPSEALISHLTAVWLLDSEFSQLREYASKFIQKTSNFTESDVLGLKKTYDQVKSWDKIKICSIYTNESGSFVEYKLQTSTLNNLKQTNHYHALFQIKNEKCCFISQTTPLIRIIGDPILHQPGILFPQHPSIDQQQELANQIEHAKSILIQTGGAGIAANQCAGIEKPFQFTIVGVFHNDLNHVTGVTRRYPTAKFPEARIMINPIIISSSKTTQNFNHACLSVPCPNRCSVTSPEEITVSYQDPTQNMEMVQLTLSGVDAVVLWHELTHILHGNTYIDVVFEQLSTKDLHKFKAYITDEKRSRDEHHSIIPELTVPPFYFTVKHSDDGYLKLDEEALVKVLGKMSDETLDGLLTRCQHSIASKKNCIAHENDFSFSSICASMWLKYANITAVVVGIVALIAATTGAGLALAGIIGTTGTVMSALSTGSLMVSSIGIALGGAAMLKFGLFSFNKSKAMNSDTERLFPNNTQKEY